MSKTDWGRASRQQDPYVRWGDSVTLDFGSLNNGVIVQQREFQRIQLPRPTQCLLNYSFRVTPKTAGAPLVDYTAINYRTGVGSSGVNIRRVYPKLPQVPPLSAPLQPGGTPLDVTHSVAVQDLYAQVEAQAFDCIITFTLWLSPVALEELGG